MCLVYRYINMPMMLPVNFCNQQIIYWHIGILFNWYVYALSLTLLQVSFRDTVRLKINFSGVESLSTLK